MNAKLFWQNVQWQVWPQINPRVWRIGFHGWAGRKGRASFSTFWRSRKMKFSIFNLLMEPLLYICSWMKRIMSSNLNKGRLVHHLYCIQAVYITEFTSRWNKMCTWQYSLSGYQGMVWHVLLWLGYQDMKQLLYAFSRMGVLLDHLKAPAWVIMKDDDPTQGLVLAAVKGFSHISCITALSTMNATAPIILQKIA